MLLCFLLPVLVDIYVGEQRGGEGENVSARQTAASNLRPQAIELLCSWDEFVCGSSRKR